MNQTTVGNPYFATWCPHKEGLFCQERAGCQECEVMKTMWKKTPNPYEATTFAESLPQVIFYSLRQLRLMQRDIWEAGYAAGWDDAVDEEE